MSSQKSKTNPTRILMNIGFTIGIIGVAFLLLMAFVIIPLLIKANRAPTPELAEQACTKLDGKYESADLNTIPQDFYGMKLTGAYTCSAKDDEDSDSGFQMMTFEKDNLTTDTAKKAIYAFITQDEENAEESAEKVSELTTTVKDDGKIYKSYIKLNDESDDIYYFAAYKNVLTTAIAENVEAAEEVLIDLGYPEPTDSEN